MPAHGHGMNYRPSIVSLGDGFYEVRGLMFHMPGSWQFKLDYSAEGEPGQVLLDYVI